jgi:hypothetical protein
MDARFSTIAAIAAVQHSVISLTQLEKAEVSKALRHSWVKAGLLDRLGPQSFTVAGSDPTWMRSLTAGLFDLAGVGYVAGRSGARLLGLDGFTGDHVELLVPRSSRGRCSSGTVRSTARPIGKQDLQTIDCLRVLRAERLILESPLFGFTRDETENAIDSAIRRRLLSEQRLRTRAIDQHSRSMNGGRLLLDALVDSGGESRLERWFLRIVRDAGLPRPNVQMTFRSGSRVVARVDAFFPGGLVVELAGHGTHSSRSQRQHDAQRHTELTLRGFKVLTFTYDDVRDRPDWVIARLRDALQMQR